MERVRANQLKGALRVISSANPSAAGAGKRDAAIDLIPSDPNRRPQFLRRFASVVLYALHESVAAGMTSLSSSLSHDTGYDWLVVGVATSVTFLFGIFFSFGIFLDPLIAEFGWSSTLTSFIFSVYSVSYSFSTILIGRFADKYGSRSTIGLGGLVVTLALFLSSRVDAVWQLYLTFGIMGGMGAAAFWIPPTKAVMEYFQASNNMNLAISVVTTGTGAGMLLISPLAGFFTVEYGWRVCYLLFGLISALICALAVLIVKKPPGSVPDRVEREADPPSQGLLEAMKTRNFWALFGVTVLGNGVARYTVIVYVVVCLIAAGFPAQVGAASLGLIGGGTIIGRLASGFLVRRFRENRVVSACYAIQGLSTIAFIVSGSTSAVYASAFVFGIAYGGYIPQIPILTRESYGMAAYGLIYGGISSGLGVGALFGPPILGGYLFAMSGNYFLTFATAAAFSLVASVVALLIKSGGHTGLRL